LHRTFVRYGVQAIAGFKSTLFLTCHDNQVCCCTVTSKHQNF